MTTMMTTTTTMKKEEQRQRLQQQRLVLPPRCLLLLLILVSTCATCQSFATTRLPTLSSQTTTRCTRSTALFLSDPENQNESEKDNNNDTNINNDSDILSRFISPVIDDPALPLSDVLVAQIIAPSIQVVWLSLNHAPAPGWLKPIFDTNEQLFAARGSLVAPALIHGAALASCWIVGALAAKTYERAAIAPTEENPGVGGYGTVLWRVVQAGAFATGVLILATQADLLLEYKGQWVQPGDSPEIDLRILTGAVEVINDVFFEALCLVTWRLFLARQTATNSNWK
jgi:hypothetical protein